MFVIERYIADRLCYWACGARGRGPRDDWSEDFGFAVKFADRESASAVLIHGCGHEGRVTEHAMMHNA